MELGGKFQEAMKSTPLKKVSKKQAVINRNWKLLTEYLAQYRAQGLCELCHQLPDWRGLAGHHVVKRRFNIHTAGNCLIACGRCHDHTKHGEGIEMYRDDALVLVMKLNNLYGIAGDMIIPPK